jgi:ABC-type lipoprotein release transport system permease subunit
MNPLSPFAYHRRHKRRALMLAALVCLATVGVCITVRLLDSVIEYSGVLDGYLTRLSLVYGGSGPLDPGVVSQIRGHPDVAHAIPYKSLYIVMPIVVRSFDLFGVSESDVQALFDVCDLRLREGRLMQARTNEVVLSEEIADALGLQVGDRIGGSIDERAYQDIPTELVLVGILTGQEERSSPSIRLGLVSYEYLDSHELYASRPDNLIVVPRDGRKDAVDRLLEARISSPRTRVMTYRLWSAFMAQGQLFFHLILGIVDCLVAVVIALAVAMINQIALSERTAEFGVLSAIGQGRGRLVRRLMLEIATVAAVGWIAGLILSWLVFAGLKVSVYESRGLELDLASFAPVWFAALIPLFTIAFVAFGTARTLARLDSVAIIERGKLSMEVGRQRRPRKRSSARPLSSWIFYLRHGRRGVVLVVTVALMILGVSFPVFALAPMAQANHFFLERLRYFSVVAPMAGNAVDPAITAQIRTHPAVRHVAPAVELGLLVDVPPVNKTHVFLYGVLEGDLPELVDLLGLRLEGGRWLRPHANEIVISRAVAMNRGLDVGDMVGQPVYSDDYSIPTTMVVVGVFSRPPTSRPMTTRGADSTGPSPELAGGDLWSGFASYEYVRDHEAYASLPVSLLVVPIEGRKAELDAWLEEHVASQQTAVHTYGAGLIEYQRGMQTMLLSFSVPEALIAVVAALALAVLSYNFFVQRRDEFGTLHALGHSRRWLILRTMGETASAVAVGWLLGAAVCMAGLVYMQHGIYRPKGLTLNLLDPTPWVFTFPIPLAVVAVSAGLVVWMLSRLDPVSIIEGR